MKTVIATILTGLFLSYAKGAAADTIPPGGRLVNIHTQSIFVPSGFDDNDETVVVLDGYLPDTCFKIAPAVVTKDLEHKQIIVEQMAREFAGPCFDMTVPFTTVVNVGVLPQGDFLVTSNQGQTTDRLPIKMAPSMAPDDYLYAPVDSVQVEERAGGTFVAILNGRFTNTCAFVENVMITNHAKTIEVMPVMNLKRQAGLTCAPSLIPFRQEVGIPSVGPGRHLLHVRSLDGQSVNVVFRGLPVAAIK